MRCNEGKAFFCEAPRFANILSPSAVVAPGDIDEEEIVKRLRSRKMNHPVATILLVVGRIAVGHKKRELTCVLRKREHRAQ